MSDICCSSPCDFTAVAHPYKRRPEIYGSVGAYSSGAAPSPGYTSLSGSVTLSFKWAGAAGQTVPPLYVLLNGNVGLGGLNPQSGSSATVSDGLGDPTMYNWPQGMPWPISYNTTGKHLVQMAAPQGAGPGTVLSLSAVTLSAGGTQGNANLSLSGTVDSRSLTLSCPTSAKVPQLDDSGNQTTDANGDPNFTTGPEPTDPDGTGHGDTIYSYHSFTTNTNPENMYPNTDNPVFNWVNFTPGFSGNWHDQTFTDDDGNPYTAPDILDPATFEWSPNESDDTWNAGKCEMGFAQNFAYQDGNPDGQDAPAPYHVSYSATDNTDGATGSSSFVLTVHDPYEQNYPDHVNSDFVNPQQVSEDLISSGPDDTLGGNVTVQVSYSLSASAAGPVSWLIGKALNINLAASVSHSFSTASNVSTKGLPPGWYTYVEQYEHYYDHVGKADSWTAGGYGGTSPYYIREVPSNDADCYALKMAPPQQGNVEGGGP